MKLPIAKNADMIVQQTGNELFVYNLITHKAVCLNETSKIVYQSCDGKQTFDDLKRKYKFSDDLIYLTLDELKKNDLIAEYYQPKFDGVSRRQVIRKIGLASMIALPIVSGLVAPQVVSAASCTGGACGCACNSTNANCNSVVGIQCGTDPNGYVTLTTPCANPSCRCIAAPVGQADVCQT